MKTLKEWKKEMDALVASMSKEDGKRIQDAMIFAEGAHEGATRKSTGEPYIVHPYEVCLVASTVTDDVNVLIAALLHDVVEDTDRTIEDIRERFGDVVASYVGDESEDKMENIPKALSWMIRKEKFLNHLKKAPVESKTICLGDKISNLRSTVAEYKRIGDDVWNTFNQKDPKRHAWYYRTIGHTLWLDFDGTEAFEEYKELFFILFDSRLKSYVSANGGLSMVVNELKTEGSTVSVSVSGRITSSNADDFLNGAKEIVDAHPGCDMIYDLSELEMISSAGLRVFLKLRKSGVNFTIINASAEVYEVFDITGFVQMFDIKKAYRKMSIEGCEKIGAGAKGVVYKIDDEVIIKVYKDPDCMDDIVKERECAKKALVLGVPTAIPFDIVLVDGKFGSVFELVNAKSVTKTIIAEPEKREETIAEYASIMREMHEVIDDGHFGIELPKVKDEVKGWAEFTKGRLSDDIYKKAVEFADSLKDSKNLLHGDGHPNNVMCTRDGQIFIDMDTLCVGDPLADIAVVYAALIGYKIVDPENHFIPLDGEATKGIWDIFIRSYCKGASDSEIEEIEAWCKKFTYLRLYRRGVRKVADRPSFAENAKRELEKVFA